MSKHLSDSTQQQKAEAKLLAILGHKVGCTWLAEKNPVNEELKVKIDGVSMESRILCEVYAHIGQIKGGQSDKIAADILKLNFAEKWLGGAWRKILLFHDVAACKKLKGASWLARVCKDSGIEIEVVDTGTVSKNKILTAQRKQRR